MSLASQLQTRYEWTPNYRLVLKKPVPKDCKTFTVPQTTGQNGWIVFTYENNIPVCYWISTQECKKVPCVADERICGDTFLRVEKIDELNYIVSDIWMYNSNCVFVCSTFEQRYNWLKVWLPLVTKCIENVTIDLIHKSEMADEMPIKGYEEYLDENGKHGYFVEKDDSELLQVVKMSLPDCYEIVGKGYLRVPDLKTSVYLRSKGDTFTCKCVKFDEEFWDVVENIPEVEVNAS
jgi:hypothetical protein